MRLFRGARFGSAGGGSGAQTLAQTLFLGNGTGGLPIIVDEGDQIRFDRADGRDNTTLERLAGTFVIDAGDAQAGSGFNGTSVQISPGSGDGAGVRGVIDVDAAKIVSLATPTNANDAVTKQYADALVNFPLQSITGVLPQTQIDSIVSALVALGFATDDR